MDHDAVAAIGKVFIQPQVDARERNAQVMVEGAADRHDLFIQFVVSQGLANIRVDIDHQRDDKREVVAFLLRLLRFRPFRIDGRDGGLRLERILLGLFGGGGLAFLHDHQTVGDERDQCGQAEELHFREARNQADEDKHDRAEHDGFRLREELVDDVDAQRLGVFRADARDDDTGRDGDEQRGNLGDEAVADGQDGVCLDGFSGGHAAHQHADAETADDVDGGDDETRDGVAFDELHGTVHGAEQLAFGGEFGTALAGLVDVDGACAHIGVDTHLLTGHGVQCESRGDFGDTLRTFRDDDELHDCDNKEDDGADDEIAADDEVTENVDDFAGVGLQEDKSRRRHVQGQSEQCGEQQHAGERGEGEGPRQIEGEHQHDGGDTDVGGDQQVDDRCRQRDDEQADDGDDKRREDDVAESADVG